MTHHFQVDRGGVYIGGSWVRLTSIDAILIREAWEGKGKILHVHAGRAAFAEHFESQEKVDRARNELIDRVENATAPPYGHPFRRYW